jgi:hypothetical protein
MCALAAWTFAVLLLIPMARFKAAAQGSVNAGDDFRYGESARVPGAVALPWLYFALRVLAALWLRLTVALWPV